MFCFFFFFFFHTKHSRWGHRTRPMESNSAHPFQQRGEVMQKYIHVGFIGFVLQGNYTCMHSLGTTGEQALCHYTVKFSLKWDHTNFHCVKMSFYCVMVGKLSRVFFSRACLCSLTLQTSQVPSILSKMTSSFVTILARINGQRERPSSFLRGHTPGKNFFYIFKRAD